MPEFGEALRAWRVARGLTQEELAERARLTVKAIGALERGERRRPYPHTVRVLVDALRLDDAERAALIALVPVRAPGSGRSPAPIRQLGRGPGDRGFSVGPVEVADPTVRVRVETPVIGRDDEIALVAELVRARRHRLVTVTGPGGVGKTALATAVVDRVRDAFTGVVVVELAEITEVAGVVPAIAKAVGALEVRGSSALALVPLLEGRQLLLVLCNVEHLLGVASEVAMLVQACPDLVVLTTSRAPLRIREEHLVRVAPLALDDAVTLFRDRVNAAGVELDRDARTDAAVRTLCERADGLPLAVELAASSAALLGPTTLVARMGATPPTGPRDLPDRQRTMGATLAWSHALLSAAARGLVARLAVCVGSFSLEIAEAIGTGTDDPDDLMPALVELLEHSLVSRASEIEGTQRFRMLGPVREDAAARLLPAQLADARSRLAGAARTTVMELAEDLRNDRFVPAVHLLEAEMGNMRIAVDTLLDEARPDDVADLIWAARQFLAVNGHCDEAVGWLRRVDGRAMSDRARARSMVAEGSLEFLTGDIRRVQGLLAEAVRLARRTDDLSLIAEAAVLNAMAAAVDQELDVARALLEEAEEDIERADAAEWRFHALVAAATIARRSGDLDAAGVALRDAESLARRTGNPRTTTTALLLRGDVAVLDGAHADAADHYAEAAELADRIGDAGLLGCAVIGLAGVAAQLGEPATAAWLFGVSTSSVGERSLTGEFPPTKQHAARGLASIRDDLEEVAFADAWQGGRSAGPAEVVEMARALAARSA